jgi:hypothetical protein
MPPSAEEEVKSLADLQYEDQIPFASEEDIEFSEELADEEDQEAQQRAEEANRRVLSNERE